MIVIVFWVIENNLVYLREDRSDCDKILPGSNLVYFAQKRWLICDCDSFLGY